MRVLLRVVLLGLVVASLGPARALAEPAPEAEKARVLRAKQFVDAGLAAQDAGDYDRAIELYTKAYQVKAHPVLLFNMAQAHRLAGRVERAIELYTRYLQEDAGGPQAGVARGWLADLERRQVTAEARQHKAGERGVEARKAGDRNSRDRDEAAADPRRADHRRTEPHAADERGVEARKASDHKGDPGTAELGKADARAGGERGGGERRAGERGDGGADLHAAGGGGGAADEARAAGDLVIRARTSSGAQVAGEVLVDDGRKGALAGGALTVAKLPEGRHSIAIEAGGYRRFEATVAIRTGERVSLDAVLVEAEAARPGPSKAWHWTLVASAMVGTSAIAFSFYSGERSKSEANKVLSGGAISDEDCGRMLQFTTPSDRRAFESACTWHGREVAGYAVVGVSLLGATLATVMLLRDPAGDAATTGAPANKPVVAVAPFVMPSGGGAAVSLAW
jgi:hypothetical protein